MSFKVQILYNKLRSAEWSHWRFEQNHGPWVTLGEQTLSVNLQLNKVKYFVTLFKFIAHLHKLRHC